MDRLEVVSGLPDEPSSLDEACEFPGPSTFLEALFQACAGVVPGPARVEREDEKPREESTTYGCRGDERIGWRFEEWRCLETSAIPMRCVWETYGLPGIELRWQFSLDKVGQGGFCGFLNGRLSVGFADAERRMAFVRVWETVFRRAPGFRPAPPPEARRG